MDIRTKNIIGKKFGRLKVISYSHSYNTHAFWNVLCNCGVTKIVSGSAMKQGTTTSCGCYGRSISSKWLKSYANSDRHKNENNPMWKKNAGYFAIHDWVKRRLIRPKKCQFCKKEKKLDLASKSHGCVRSLTDWLWLCRKCHIQYDK